MDDFLKIPKKISEKKRRSINIFKQRRSIPKTIMISTLDKSRKDGLPILILEIEVSTLATKQINMAIIGADT